MRYLFLTFVFVLALSAVGISQTRTVTNNDLASYREKRLAAEKELRENYEKLGFPSPEVRAGRNAQAAKELTALSAKIRAERLEQERREADLSRAIQAAWPTETRIVWVNGLPNYYYYYPNYGWRYNTRSREYVQPGYFAGGMFIATGPRNPMRPVFPLRNR
ncbi:MAG TPA: hypothetical protein PKA82_03375 [Pyrinomonadaceae bacterium]|nr:hypothetical protein [Pyrinomonadaceae bacterium]